MKVKLVLRRDLRLLRLFRLMWQSGIVGDRHGYSCMFTVALYPRLFRWERESRDVWRLWVVGLRFHFERAYGGIHV